MNAIERIIAAAAEHGRQSEPDHEVGDLQQALRVAWELFTAEQADRSWPRR
jgi:hypothetical protein